MQKINHSKKAQVSLFIIIGIVLVVISGITWYIYSAGSQTTEAQIQDAIEEAPAEIRPVQEYVSSCLDNVMTDGIMLLGQHGGYINLLDEEISGKQFKIDILNPTESEAVLMDNNVDHNVAYWWFMDTPNDCTDCRVTDSNIPSIGSIEEQMNRYVEKEMPGCIDGFREFDKQGFKITDGNMSADVRVNEDDVTVFFEYPLSIDIDGRSTDIYRFFVRIPLDFGEFYEVANAIVDAEVEQNFLEDVVIYLLSVYSSPNMARLPPIFAREFGGVKKFWFKNVVRQQISDLLSVYVPLIQLSNTFNGEPYVIEQSSGDQIYYSVFHRDFPVDTYGNYSVRFLYMGQPVYLHTIPDKDMITAYEVKERKLELMGVAFGSPSQEILYEVLYDVSFPVIVEIKKENALFDRPYSFYIALEGNVRNNRDLNRWMSGEGTMPPFDRSKIVKKVLEETLMDEEARSIPHLDGNITKSLFCSERQRLSGNVSIIVTNGTGDDILNGVEIRYGCGNHRECFIGTTQWDIDIEKSTLISQMPLCVGGGYLRISKDGFREKMIAGLTTEIGDDQKFEVALEPLVSRNVSVKKFVVMRETVKDENGKETNNWLEWNPVAVPLEEKDQVILTVNKVDIASYERPFTSTLVISGNDSANTPGLMSLDLVPGEYIIAGQYQDMVGVVIPATCSDNLEENMTMTPAMLGGIELNGSYPWKIDYDDIFSGDSVEIYVVVAPPPRCFDDFNETEEIKDFYTERRSELNPKFI